MSIFNDKALKGVADAVSKIMDEELKGNQHKIDANKNGKVDAHDFKLLRAKKGMKEEAEKMAKKDHDQDGKVESGKAEYLGSRIRAAKMAGKMKEEAELEEAFPTVADAKKRMEAGKTATGSVTKTKTGLVHKRDYKDDDNDDADDTQKKAKGYGARQNFKRSTRVNEGKLSFVEMLQLYNEAGVEVINKIAPQTVKFGDTEVELIDANIVNGAVAVQVEEGVMSAVKGAVGVVKDVISKERAYQAQKQMSTGNTLKKLRKEESLSEEPDNETFTKEVEAQKEKNAGRGKKAQVAKASVQAVKQEEVELDEAKKPMSKDEKDKVVAGVQAAMLKSRGNVIAGQAQRAAARLAAKIKHGMKEDFEQIDEISADLAGKYLTAPKGKGANKYKTGEGTSRYPNADTMIKHGKSMKRALQRADTSSLNKKPSYYKEDEQLDEISKGTLGSYIKKASHDVAAKGAVTRHFADKSRAETAAQKHDLAKDSMKRSDRVFASGWKRREGMAKAVDRLTKEDIQLDERTLTPGKTSKKEEIVKSMKKGLSGFKQRYGDKAKSVMYATATKQAKKD
jgi:hypothetical protein